MDDVLHNLVAVATLVDAGYSVHMYYWGFEVDYNGETIHKGWREPNSKLFKMSLVDDGTEHVVPETDLTEYDGSSGLVLKLHHVCSVLVLHLSPSPLCGSQPFYCVVMVHLLLGNDCLHRNPVLLTFAC